MQLEPQTAEARAELVSHDEYLRALARRLVHDEHLANDVVQDTWVAVLAHPPEEKQSMRAWLSRVIQNRVVQNFRSRARRENRERASVRADLAPSPADECELEGVRATVLETLRSLDEPYRATLMLRFYEGLAPREIARELAVPVETVRTRIKRGMEMVRARLDREFGSDSAFAVALVRFAHSGARPQPRALPRFFWWGLGAAAGFVALASFVASRGSTTLETAVALAGFRAAPAHSPNALMSPAGAAERSASSRAVRTLDLRVLSEDESPLSNAALEFDSGGRRFSATTGADGSARVELDAELATTLQVAATDDTFAAFEPVPAANDAPWIVHVKNSSSVAGRVLDREHRALDGAEVVALTATADGRTRGAELARTRADSQGRFRITGLPQSFALEAQADGWFAPERAVAELEHAGRVNALDLVLARAETLVGRVLDARGHAVADAEVRASWRHGAGDLRAAQAPNVCYVARDDFEIHSASDGRFELAVLATDDLEFAARKSGYAASRPTVARDGELELVLRDASVTTVAVLAQDGTALEGAQVALVANDDRDAPRARASDVNGIASFDDLAPDAQFVARVSAAGRELAFIGPLRAGQSTTVALASSRCFDGRLIDANGDPLEGAVLEARATLDVRALRAAALAPADDFTALARAVSDASGRFHFARLDQGAFEIAVRPSGAPAATRTFAFEAGVERGELVLDSASAVVARVVGSVRDARTLASIDEFDLSAVPLDSAASNTRAERRTAAQGRFDLELGASGRWLVIVKRSGFAPATATIDAQSGANRLEFELQPVRDLALRVVDAEGAPLAGSRVALRDENGAQLLVPAAFGEWRSTVCAGPYGEIFLHDVPASTLLLTVSLPWRESAASFRLDAATLPRDTVELALDDVASRVAVRRASVAVLDGVEYDDVLYDRYVASLDRQEPDASSPRFAGFATLRVVDADGHVVADVAGTLGANGLRSQAGDPALFVRWNRDQLPSRATAEDVSNSAAFATGADPLSSIPVPVGGGRIEITAEGRAALAFEFQSGWTPGWYAMVLRRLNASAR